MTAPVLYGVWIPGVGWLAGRKSADGTHVPLSFESREVAEETARRIGHGARIFYIDDSLAAIENDLLVAEQEQKQKEHKLWHGLTTLLRNLW